MPRTTAEQFGAWLGGIRLHEVEPRLALGGSPTIAKRRRRFVPPLIGLGNLALRLMGSGIRVLPDPEWHARERALHLALHAIELEAGPEGWLILPRWPGVVLADLARDRREPAPSRLLGLAAAVRALRALHRVDLRGLGRGAPGPLSHGDATARNVLFDFESGIARWFDFDTAHDPNQPSTWRHADDLRALIYSAAESFVDLPVTALLRTVRDAYPDPAPWGDLRDRLSRGTLHRSLLHLAQACPSLGRRRELESLLLLREA